jgi:hypothetical protein
MPSIHMLCPEHGDQQVTGISGDLLVVTLACGANLTSGDITHPVSPNEGGE